MSLNRHFYSILSFVWFSFSALVSLLFFLSFIHSFFPFFIVYEISKQFLTKHITLQHLRCNSVLFIHLGWCDFAVTEWHCATLKSAPHVMVLRTLNEGIRIVRITERVRNTSVAALCLFMKLTEFHIATNSVQCSDYCGWWLNRSDRYLS